jgi:major vault protein
VHQGGIKQLQTIENDSALRIQATREFVADDGTERKAGDEWLVYGPSTYTPRVEEEVKEKVRSLVIKQNSALKLRATKDCTSKDGVERKCGEEWLVREVGAYLPSVNESVVSALKAQVLTEKRALHLRAERTFTDVYGIDRKAGSEWLITFDMAETHLQDVHEETVGTVGVTTLSQRQYAILENYYEGDEQKLGCRKLIKGEVSFFLKPGEVLGGGGIQDIYVLSEDEALLLQAMRHFKAKNDGDGDGDGSDKSRVAGERWMIYGPCEYVPSVEVEVVETRRQMPLDENEGVYVRDIKKVHVHVRYY